MERGVFRYLKWQELYNTERPFQILIDIPADAEDKRQTNMEFYDGSELNITDVRSITDSPDIDIHGFKYVHHNTCLESQHFFNKEKVELEYLPECEALLRNMLDGVDEVHFFNWLVLSMHRGLIFLMNVEHV